MIKLKVAFKEMLEICFIIMFGIVCSVVMFFEDNMITKRKLLKQVENLREEQSRDYRRLRDELEELSLKIDLFLSSTGKKFEKRPEKWVVVKK